MSLALQTLTDWWRGNRAAGRRSTAWPRVRREWLGDHPECAACGTMKSLEVHHLVPVQVNPLMELVSDNLLTLCRRCHLLVGHCDDWGSWNAEAVADAARLRDRIRRRPNNRDPLAG